MKTLEHIRQTLHKILFRTMVRGRISLRHVKMCVKWLIFAICIGCICGLVGTLFMKAMSLAAATAAARPWTLFLLPAAGLLILLSYRGLEIYDDEGTNSILRSARAEDASALRVAPLIFTATCLTHLCSGSAGREGAALQIGGSIGSFLGRAIRLNRYEQQMSVMCGMSAVFCALLGTPMTAAFFAIEVAGVGTVFYAGLVPSVIASIIARQISLALGVPPLSFPLAAAQPADLQTFGKVLILAWLAALLSIIYCSAMHYSRHLYAKCLGNPYLRVFVGGCLVILVTLLIGCRDYNGAGTGIIAEALAGNARPEAFVLKLILTALTLGAGYKGGEIIPTFFIGATFGCTLAGLLGLDPMFAAEIALIATFCGAVNCPVSSIFLSIELFDSGNFLFFGLAAAISYLFSGYHSLYSGQKFMNSKLVPLPFERKARKL